MRRLAVAAAFLIVAISAACGRSSNPSGTTANARRDPNIMDSTEIRGGHYSTVYDAVSARHADWLLPRGGPQAGRPATLGVWVEGETQRPRGVDYLRTLRPADVKQVRRLSITEATHTYSWPWGGLVITMR